MRAPQGASPTRTATITTEPRHLHHIRRRRLGSETDHGRVDRYNVRPLPCDVVSGDRRHHAVLFDLGGVVFPSPFEAFDRYDERVGIPIGFTRSVVRVSSESGAWAALERGELTLGEFHTALEAEAVVAGHRIDAARMMATIGEAGGARPAMLVAIARLRDAGLRVGALTNNWADDRLNSPEDRRQSPGREQPEARDESRVDGPADLVATDLFDAVVESSKVGLRKPDPRIYELALSQLGVAAEVTVFLDDLGINLKPARAMGMATIKVVDHVVALRELGTLLDLELV